MVNPIGNRENPKAEKKQYSTGGNMFFVGVLVVLGLIPILGFLATSKW